MDGSEDLDAQALDTQAKALLDMMRPRRRPRPRLAPVLADAEDREVETSYGAVMAWRVAGRPTTLAVHGWEDDSCLWGPLIDHCVEIGRGVIAFDLPGHGFSQAENASPTAAAAAIRAVAEALGPIDSIVTHSFGGMAAVKALADGLQVERAVLIASGGTKIGSFRDRLKQRGVPEAVIARAEALTFEQTGQRTFIPHMEDELPAMTARALIVHAMDDDQVPVAHADRIAELWPGAQLALYDDLGHRPIAQDPAALERVVAFLEGAS